MSQANTSSSQINLQLTPDARKGAGRYRATALVGERVLFADAINLGSSRSRNAFLNALKRRAVREKIVCDPEAWEGILLQQHGADQVRCPDEAQASGHIENYELVLERLGRAVVGADAKAVRRQNAGQTAGRGNPPNYWRRSSAKVMAARECSTL